MSSRPVWLERFFHRADELGAHELSWLDSSPVAPKPSASSETKELLAVRLGEERYVLPIERVREIVKVPVLTWVPPVQPGLLGVMNLRGEVLPVYDVKPRLSLSDVARVVTGPGDASRESRVVLVRDDAGDAGVLVDAVQGVVRLAADAVEPPPPGAGDRSVIAGLGRLQGELYIVLDVGGVLP